MSAYEIIGAMLGIANVFLISRRSMWNWPIGIAMTVLYTYIFFDAKLYSDTVLQIFFTVVQLFGWAQWFMVKEDNYGEIPITTMPWWSFGGYMYLTLLGSVFIGYLFHTHTDAAYPYVDSIILALSVMAQFLLNYRKLEAWVLWIMVDLIAVPLYWIKDLHVTSGLYMVFLGLAIYGFYEWNKANSIKVTS